MEGLALMPATLTKEGDALVLDLSTARGTEFKEALDKIREVPGRRYDPRTRPGTCRQTPAPLIESSIPSSPLSLTRCVIGSSGAHQGDRGLDYCLSLTMPSFYAAQRTHCTPIQRAFVDLAARKRFIINADDMGLGKTVQALGAVTSIRRCATTALNDGPKLIVCPNSVKGVWAREIVKWLGDNEPHQIIDGTSAKARHNQLVLRSTRTLSSIVNYEQLRVEKEKLKSSTATAQSPSAVIEVMKQPLFEVPFLAAAKPSLDDLDAAPSSALAHPSSRTGWLACVADEAHRAKNRRASQTKGLHRTALSSSSLRLERR
jgi:hypothetical protein